MADHVLGSTPTVQVRGELMNISPPREQILKSQAPPQSTANRGHEKNGLEGFR